MLLLIILRIGSHVGTYRADTRIRNKLAAKGGTAMDWTPVLGVFGVYAFILGFLLFTMRQGRQR